MTVGSASMRRREGGHRSPRPDRELVAAIRAELASIDPARECDRIAEAAGLADADLRRDASIARLVHRLGVVPGEAATFAWEASPEHCRLAWLRGRFLARGSLSLAAGRTHLEFVLPPDEARVLVGRLDTLDLPATWRLRRGRGVVTWKSGETVGMFLRRVGGGAALLELEARQVTRALRGELNRVLNAESANLQRAVFAAGRQLSAIQMLDADGRLALLPYTTRLVADARRETPEATFTELAERLGVHRSAVQRALERIEWLALHDDPADRPPRPGRGPGRRGHAGRATTGPTDSDLHPDPLA